MGADAFHGLVKKDSSAALVLAALRRSQALDLVPADAWRDASVEAHSGLAPCGTRLQAVMRQLNLNLMQRMPVRTRRVVLSNRGSRVSPILKCPFL